MADRYPAIALASWLLAEARWQRDQLDDMVLRLQEQAGEMAEEIERLRREVEFEAHGTNSSLATGERSKALLNIAAHEAIKRDHTDRVDMFVTAFVDHLDGPCPAAGECFAEQTARKALAEYGVEVRR